MTKVAVITGASRGIGEAIATLLAQNGINISICSKNSRDELLSLASKLEATCHIKVMTHIGDIGDYSFATQLIKDTLEEFGHIDYLINNAGKSYVGLLSDMSNDDWNTIISTNLSSVFYTCKACIPSMVHNKCGKIINISSVWGNVGASCEVAYSASKGAINSLTKALAKELAPSNISVNAIACGVIDTQMNSQLSGDEKKDLSEEIPAGRFGTVSEVAQLVYSLISTSNYLTGQILTIDGGWT